MVSPSKLVSYEWYISIVCACGERLVMSQDLTEGKGSLAGSFEVTCPVCGERGTYAAQHYQHQPETSSTEKAVSFVS